MKYLVLAIVALAASPALAHPDHDEVRQLTPSEAARQHVVRMITQSKLAPSWSRATLQGTSSRTVNGSQQTVVTFTNSAEPAARRTLHVVLDADGTVVSANPSEK